MAQRVLVCDDAMFMRSMIRRVLTGAGYEIVAEAGDCEEAVARYKEFRPALVTMDLVMPGASGIEAVRAIREFDPEARIVVCSAMGSEQLLEQARIAGAKGFVLKPFKPEALLAESLSALA